MSRDLLQNSLNMYVVIERQASALYNINKCLTVIELFFVSYVGWWCGSSPLGFVGFLTELSCPLTSCSRLSSSRLFSRVSSSLDLPTAPFFTAEMTTQGSDKTDMYIWGIPYI